MNSFLTTNDINNGTLVILIECKRCGHLDKHTKAPPNSCILSYSQRLTACSRCHSTDIKRSLYGSDNLPQKRSTATYVDGAMRFQHSPDPIKTECELCNARHSWTHKELKKKGLKPNAPMPDVKHGLARLLNCERMRFSECERKSNPCQLRYINLRE